MSCTLIDKASRGDFNGGIIEKSGHFLTALVTEGQFLAQQMVNFSSLHDEGGLPTSFTTTGVIPSSLRFKMVVVSLILAFTTSALFYRRGLAGNEERKDHQNERNVTEVPQAMKVAMQTPPPPPLRAPPSRQSTVQWDFVDDKHDDDGEVENDDGDDDDENDDDENNDDDNDENNDGEGFTPVIGNSTRKRRLLINNVNNNRSRNNIRMSEFSSTPIDDNDDGQDCTSSSSFAAAAQPQSLSDSYNLRYSMSPANNHDNTLMPSSEAYYQYNNRHDGHGHVDSPATGIGESVHSSNLGSFYFQNHHPVFHYNNNCNAASDTTSPAAAPNANTAATATGILPPHLAYWMQMGSAGSKSSVYGHHVPATTTMIRQPQQQYNSNMKYSSSNEQGQQQPLNNDRQGAVSNNNNNQQEEGTNNQQDDEYYTIYPTRYLMLAYMSILNLLSDWTCYSIAPIAQLTKIKFGTGINPEGLVTIFLLANTISTILEPAILGRLGLRRTVLVGALLLMCGSIVKSSGVLHAVRVDVEEYRYYDHQVSNSSSSGGGDGNSNSSNNNDGSCWRLYLGFFLVGLSQPLYQCTPALQRMICC